MLDAAGRFLGVLGAIIGLLVLSTGAQRRAVLSYSPQMDGTGLEPVTPSYDRWRPC